MNQIRLLKLHPGQPGSQIDCTIKVVDLLAYDDFNLENTNDKDWEWFHAVSYAWGKGACSVRINCNGLVAYISQTLADALQTFRQKDDLILWIDALCINQNDISERAAQVKLMGLIYFKARKVRIWLGRDDEVEAVHSAEGVADLIKTFAELWISCRDGNSAEVSESIFQEPNVAQLPQWEGIRRLYQRPWFSRVWVVQELGLASDATFYCGDFQFDEKELYCFQLLLQYSKPGRAMLKSINTQTTDLGTAYRYSTRTGMRNDLGEDPQDAETFFDILLASQGLQCTDPRDGIYAFLGHPSAFKRQRLDIGPYMWYPQSYYEKMSTIISPRYDKSYKYTTLCIDLAIASIRDRGLAFDMLACIDHDHKTIAMKFPSWVPRWDTKRRSTPLPGSRVYYNASKGFSDPPFWVMDTGKLRKHPRLVCRAMKICIIRSVTQDLTGKSPAWIASTMAQFLSDIPQEGNQSQIKLPTACFYPYEDDFLLVLASSLTAGLTSDHYLDKMPADEHKEFHLSIFKAWYRQKQALRIGMKLSSSDVKNADHFQYIYDCHYRSRSLFITPEGRFGLGPLISKSRDEVWLPMGAKTPLILRPTGKGTYKVIGEAFLYNAMRGEAVQGKCEKDFEVTVLE